MSCQYKWTYFAYFLCLFSSAPRCALQAGQSQIFINKFSYLCCDGHVPTVRTQDLKTQFNFPASFGMKLEDFMPFFGSYSGKVDYILEDETKRMKVTKDSIQVRLYGAHDTSN